MKRNGFQTMAGLFGLMSAKLKGFVVFALFFGFLGNGLGILSVFFGLLALAKGIDGVTDQVLLWASLALGAGILRGIFKYFEQYANHFIAFTLLAQIRHRLFDALIRLSPAKLVREKMGNLVSMLTADIETLEVFYAHTVSPIGIAVLVSLGVTVLVSLSSSWVLGLSYFLAFWIIGAVCPVISYRLQAMEGPTYRKALGDFTAKFLDRVDGAAQIVQAGQEEAVLAEADQASRSLSDQIRSNKRKASLISSFQSLLVSLLSVGIAIVGLALFQAGTLSLGLAILGVGTAISSFATAISLANLPANLSHTFASGNRLLDLLKESPAVTEPLPGVSFPDWDGASLNRVSFAYESNEPILTDLSLSIPKTGTLALLGPSGKGKTTILRLLLRYYDPTSGVIDYGKTDLKAIRSESLRAHVAMMGQETVLFRESIRDNLKEAKADATDEEIHEAAKKAAFEEVLLSLPQGLDTVLVPEKPNLSTGQIQRLGLTRLFLRDPDLILLDEPTSNVDPYAEKAMLQAIKKAGQTHAVVLVTHRESTAKAADGAIVLK